MGIIVCVAAFFGTYSAARKSLAKGILGILVAGYFYGIFRAHFLDTAGYFLFDVAVLGLYAGSVHQMLQAPQSRSGRQLQHWVVLLVGLPILLMFIPLQDPLIQLVGLRANIFVLPFLLLGSKLSDDDIEEISLGMSALNLIALAVAAAEFVFGVEKFIPYNNVTDLIYRSNDVGTMGAYRIPAIFANAHSYGGQMVMSLPLIIGTWSRPHRKPWHSPLLISGALAAIIGVFLSAARVHFVGLLLLVVAFTFSSRLRATQRLAWMIMLAFVFYLVSGHERMQRFETLKNRQMVSERIESSVNASLFDAVTQYPFGNGLGGGGSSIPYFLLDRANIPFIIESEYARIQLELGVFGLALWLAFLGWFFTRPKPVFGDPWFVGKRLAWVACFASCATGLIGIGLLTAIPTSALMFLMFGWLAAPRSSRHQQQLYRWPLPKQNLSRLAMPGRMLPSYQRSTGDSVIP